MLEEENLKFCICLFRHWNSFCSTKYTYVELSVLLNISCMMTRNSRSLIRNWNTWYCFPCGFHFLSDWLKSNHVQGSWESLSRIWFLQNWRLKECGRREGFICKMNGFLQWSAPVAVWFLIRPSSYFVEFLLQIQFCCVIQKPRLVL